MVKFSEKKLAYLLKNLNISQRKIINLSSWLFYNKKYVRVIVKTWFEQFLKARDDHKITLLYLCHELVQHGGKYPEFVREFIKILPKAFQHLTSLKTYEEKLDKDIIKLLKIWSARKVFTLKEIISLSKILNPSICNYGVGSPGRSLKDISFEDVNDFKTMSPQSFIRNVKTEDKSLIEMLTLLKEPPTCDAKIRGEIGDFPREVFDVETLNNVNNKRSAYDLVHKVDYALQVISHYNSRLNYEMELREKLNLMLNGFLNSQKELFFRGKERLKKYRMKLIKIKRLQRQLMSYVSTLPEGQSLKELSPLPFDSDLFYREA